MRPQTAKAIMRDNIRRLNKCTESEKRRKQRSKRSNKRRGRRVRRVASPGKGAFTDFQLGEQEGRIVHPQPNVIYPTYSELQIDVLKEENKRMQNYIRFLIWRINDQECKNKQDITIMETVYKGRLKRSHSKLKKTQVERDHLVRLVNQIDRVVSHESLGPTMEDVKELAGIAC